MSNSSLIPVGATPTMTSLELVDFINSQRGEGEAELRHDHFMAKVPKVLGGGAPKFRDTYVNPQNGQTYPCYRFPKREACLMAMSYSYELQAKVFDRMTALEGAANDPIKALSDPTKLRQVLLGYTEKVIELENKVGELAPKAAALDLISAGDEDLTISQAAKVLGIRRDRLTSWMHAERWVFRQNESWVAYQPQINNGRLRYKEAKYTDENTGQQCVKPYCHITPKGLAKLAQVFGGGLEAA